MKLYKNREFSLCAGVFFALSVIFSGIAALIDLRFGGVAMAMCFALYGVFNFSAYLRYRRISTLADEIDRMLHGERAFDIGKYREGELAVLSSEIGKLTVKLREQNDALKGEKIRLSESIADISHQIRTPLTSVNLLISLLADRNLEPARKTEITAQLSRLVSRIDWLVASLLKMSRIDAGTVEFKKQTMSLAALAEKACAPLSISFELRAQTLTVNASGDFFGDIAWTAEALTNIIKNCSEHTHDGGTITVCALDTPIYCEIIITDTGSGIAPDDLPHIFERYYKGKNSSSDSVGIGLALAKMIITNQNGTIKASNTNQGASFNIRFYKTVV